MYLKMVSAAVLAVTLGASAVQSQTVSQIGGPKELPPAGYAAMQYIDSRGCVFLRAGMGGAVNWVPRVGQDRKVLCGYPPSIGGKAVAVATVPDAEAVGAVKPAAVAIAAAGEKPAVVAVAPVRQAIGLADYVPPPARVGTVIPTMQAPAAAARPLVVAVKPGVPVASAAGQIACPASAPRLQRLPLTNGGTVLVCTPGDGVLRGMRAPVFANGAGVGAAFEDAPARVATDAGAAPVRSVAVTRVETGRAVADVRLAAPVVAVPQGYVAAWKDDRLNPLRGVGTGAGQAMQDQVWTRKTPARLVGDTRKARREAARARASGAVLVVSSMSAPAEVRQGGYYVQAGSFGVPANAEGAMARLAAAGLPVARGRANGLIVVMAGPFGSPAEAAGARGIARAAGFGDAFVR